MPEIPEEPAVLPVIRVARPRDIEAILDHIRDSPYAYGPTLDRALASTTLARLVESRAIVATFLVDRRNSTDRAPVGGILALAITAFLSPDLADEWATQPPPAFVDDLIDLEHQHRNALLRPVEVAKRNAEGSGLDLAFLAYASPKQASLGCDVSRLIALSHDMFRVFHAGYHCRRAFHQALGKPEAIASLLSMGFRPANERSDLLVHDLAMLDHVPFHPFAILRRATAPVLGLAPAEQSMLLHALIGLTDAEIAKELAVSEETVRKRWKRVFERVAAHPELSLLPARAEESASIGRGPEKRGILQQYLSTHLEELRPYAS